MFGNGRECRAAHLAIYLAGGQLPDGALIGSVRWWPAMNLLALP
jgi:hypothetical protein